MTEEGLIIYLSVVCALGFVAMFIAYIQANTVPKWLRWVKNLPSRYIRMCFGIERKTLFRKKK